MKPYRKSPNIVYVGDVIYSKHYVGHLLRIVRVAPHYWTAEFA